MIEKVMVLYLLFAIVTLKKEKVLKKGGCLKKLSFQNYH